MRTTRRLAAAVLLSTLPLVLGCRRAEAPEDLQALAGDVLPESAPEGAAAPAASTVDGGELDAFPLVGSVFPGLGGRLHSSLCDPASDPHSTCL